MMRLRALRNGMVLFPDLLMANSFALRLKGLVGVPQLDAHQVLLIQPCRAVHTLGMRYPIDVAFLNCEGVVIKTVVCLRPYQCAAALRARQVLEMRAGTLVEKRIRVNDRLLLEACTDDC